MRLRNQDVFGSFAIADPLHGPSILDHTGLNILKLVEESARDSNLRPNPRMHFRHAAFNGFSEGDEFVHLNLAL